MKADPYSLATHTANLSLRNSLSLADANYKIWEKKEEYKDEKLKTAINDIYGPDVLKANPNAPGTGTDVIGTASGDNSKFRTGLVDNMRESQSDMLENYVTSIAAKYASATDLKQKKFYEDAMKSTFAAGGLNVANLLKGDKAEINKIAGLGTPYLAQSFAVSKDYTNPYKGKGIAASSFFSKEFYDANGQTIMDVDKNAMTFAHFENVWKEIGDGVAERTKAGYSENGVLDKKMGALVDMYVDASKDLGYLPLTKEQIAAGVQGKNPEVRQFLAKYATEYAKKYSKDFQSQSGRDDDPNSPTYGAVYTAFDAAKKYAYQNVGKIFKDYNSNYDEYGQSYRKMPGMGKGSNALASMAYEGYADSQKAAITRNGTKDLLGALQSYNAVSDDPQVRVGFGDAKSIPAENDPRAKAIVDAYYAEMLSPASASDDGRPHGKWRGQMIAGDNANYVGFTIYPNESWAKKFKGGAKTPGITGGVDYSNGITMFIPKDKVHNSFTAKMEASPYDYEFERTGKLSLDAYPDAQAEIVKSGGRKVVNLTANIIGEDGKPQVYKQTYPYDATDLQNKVLVDDWMPKLQTLQNMIDVDKSAARAQYGTKDIDAVMASQ
jgi:hypothetical protein